MAMDDELGAQSVKLPVMATLRDACALVFGNLGHLVAMAAIPLAITIAGKSILLIPTSPIAGFFEISEHGIAVLLVILLGIILIGETAVVLPWIVFVVACHRFALLRRRDSCRPLEYYIGLGEANFFKNELFVSLFLTFILIFSFILGFSILFHQGDFPPPWNPVIFTTLFLAAMVRFLFNHPAMAVGHEMDLRVAWKRSRGVGLSLFLILFLVAIPIDLLYSFIGFLGAGVSAEAVHESQKFASNLSFATAQSLVLFLGTAIFVTALCLSYQRVVAENVRPRAEAFNLFACLLEFVLTLIFGVVAGALGYWIAEFLTFPAREQGALTAAAFLIFLGWRAYRTKN